MPESQISPTTFTHWTPLRTCTALNKRVKIWLKFKMFTATRTRQRREYRVVSRLRCIMRIFLITNHQPLFHTRMHHITCGINSLLHSVNLILFTLLVCASPHHSHHLCSQHLSLPQPFTPDLKLISFINPFLHSLSGSFWTAFIDIEPVVN